MKKLLVLVMVLAATAASAKNISADSLREDSTTHDAYTAWVYAGETVIPISRKDWESGKIIRIEIKNNIASVVLKKNDYAKL